jgi:uncharacterized membrane protein
MKIFGHPLHMMLIHFPTALLPMDALFSFLAYYNKDSSFLLPAYYCLIAGVVGGGLALITGLIDLLLIKKDDKAAIATALIHGFINGMVLIFYGIFAYRSWQLFPQLSTLPLSTLILKFCLLVILFVGNYLGGKLILQHHIGVKKTED